MKGSFEEGTLTDSQGRKCSFRESVFILTRNLERVMDRLLGLTISPRLLSGEISSGAAIRIGAVDGEIHIWD